MSLMSRKWTVRAESKRLKPREKMNWTRMTTGRRRAKTVGGLPRTNMKMRRIGRPKQEVDEVARDRDEGQDLGREEDLLDQVAVDHQGVGRFDRRRGEPRPGQDPAEKEEGVEPGRIADGRVARPEDEPEDDRIDDHQEERIEERPEETEDRPPVAGLELPADQVLDEDPVLVDFLEVPDEPTHAASPRRSAAPRACPGLRRRAGRAERPSRRGPRSWRHSARKRAAGSPGRGWTKRRRRTESPLASAAAPKSSARRAG